MHIAMLVDQPSGDRASGVGRSAGVLVDGLRELGIRLTLLSPVQGQPSTSQVDAVDIRDEGRFQILRGFRPWIASVHDALEILDPDIVHGQGLLHNGIAASSWQRTPTVVTAHGDPVADARWHYPRASHPLLLPLLRKTATQVVRTADCVIDVTPDWRANCPEEPRAWIHIPNPVEPAFFTTQDPGVSSRVLYFGGSRHIKGLDVLLDAWPSVLRVSPNASLHVWGMPADDRSPIAQRCRTTPSCTLAGTVNTETVAREMRQGGVLVLPSRYEVAPVTIAEGWASGIPIVATAVGGVPAFVKDAASLCQPEQSDEIASAILAALHREPVVIAQVAQGRVRAESARRGAVATAHMNLYQRLLSGDRP